MARSSSLPPIYTESRGWVGGDSRTLYAMTDRLTGRTIVRPGGGMRGVGPNADVRVATRTEAEEGWQNPLRGWTVGE